jgi:aspartate racemase
VHGRDLRIGQRLLHRVVGAGDAHSGGRSPGIVAGQPRDPADLDAVAQGIAAVKRGDPAGGGRDFARVVASLERDGAAAIVLGCTEIPPGLAAARVPGGVPWIDPTDALARACAAAWARARTAPGPSGDRRARALDKGGRRQ